MRFLGLRYLYRALQCVAPYLGYLRKLISHAPTLTNMAPAPQLLSLASQVRLCCNRSKKGRPSLVMIRRLNVGPGRPKCAKASFTSKGNTSTKALRCASAAAGDTAIMRGLQPSACHALSVRAPQVSRAAPITDVFEMSTAVAVVGLRRRRVQLWYRTSST